MAGLTIALCVMPVIRGTAIAAVGVQHETDSGTRIPVPRRARIPVEGTMPASDRNRIVMAEFARCVYARSPKGVGAALALPSASEQSDALAKFVTSECLDAGLIRVGRTTLRASLFVDLARRKMSGDKGLPVTSPIDFKAPNLGESKQDLALLDFADCVLRTDEAAGRAFVAAPTASAEQNQALATLRPTLGPCLPAGETVKIDKMILETALAEVIYRGVVPAEKK